MNNKVTLSIFVLIFVFILGLISNFQEAMMGSSATIKNFIITILYLAIWIYTLTISSKSKNRRIIKYFSLFWLVTLLFAILTVFANVTEVDVAWTIPFVALLLTQWYGIELLVDNLLITSIVMSSVSLLIFIGTIFLLKRPNYD